MSNALPNFRFNCAESIVLLRSIQNRIENEVMQARQTLDEMLGYLAQFRDGACPIPRNPELAPSRQPHGDGPPEPSLLDHAR
jgi:hypothetical protein